MWSPVGVRIIWKKFWEIMKPWFSPKLQSPMSKYNIYAYSDGFEVPRYKVQGWSQKNHHRDHHRLVYSTRWQYTHNIIILSRVIHWKITAQSSWNVPSERRKSIGEVTSKSTGRTRCGYTRTFEIEREETEDRLTKHYQNRHRTHTMRCRWLG